jgi:hypothetical protein
MITLDARTTALVLIDLQNGIVGMSLAPRSGSDVVATASGLARTLPSCSPKMPPPASRARCTRWRFAPFSRASRE